MFFPSCSLCALWLSLLPHSAPSALDSRKGRLRLLHILQCDREVHLPARWQHDPTSAGALFMKRAGEKRTEDLRHTQREGGRPVTVEVDGVDEQGVPEARATGVDDADVGIPVLDRQNETVVTGIQSDLVAARQDLRGVRREEPEDGD